MIIKLENVSNRFNLSVIKYYKNFLIEVGGKKSEHRRDSNMCF